MIGRRVIPTVVGARETVFRRMVDCTPRITSVFADKQTTAVFKRQLHRSFKQALIGWSNSVGYVQHRLCSVMEVEAGMPHQPAASAQEINEIPLRCLVAV